MEKIKDILTEISEGKGRYDEDRLTHASNTIEDMKQLALEGIKLLQEMSEPTSVQGFKTSLTTEEFRQVKDMICEATLHHDEDIKQYFLIEIGGIMSGSKQQFLDSAEAQGYTIKEGRKP